MGSNNDTNSSDAFAVFGLIFLGVVAVLGFFWIYGSLLVAPKQAPVPSQLILDQSTVEVGQIKSDKLVLLENGSYVILEVTEDDWDKISIHHVEGKETPTLYCDTLEVKLHPWYDAYLPSKIEGCKLEAGDLKGLVD